VNLSPDPHSTPRDTIVFLVCLVLSVAARVAPAGVRDAVADAIAITVLSPFLELQHQAEILKASRGRFAQIAAVRDSAAVANLELQAMSEENVRLRELLGLAERIPVRYVAAEALHRPGPRSGQSVILSAGSQDGVTVQAPVVGLEGLIGVVQSAGPSYSVAMLWPHPDFRVSAMAADGTVFGIVAAGTSEGLQRPLLELSDVPYGDLLQPGTKVYTSGLGGPGGVYPRGIPIGTILSVGEELEGWSRSYLVQPATDRAGVTHVIILLDRVADLSDAFGVPPP